MSFVKNMIRLAKIGLVRLLGVLVLPGASLVYSFVKRESDPAWNQPNRLFPRLFAVVPTLVCLGILALYFYGKLVNFYGGLSMFLDEPVGVALQTIVREAWHWNEFLAVYAVLVLLATDWVEYRSIVETPPGRVAVGLLGLRVVLLEMVAQLDQFSFSPVLYLIVPFYASKYFGMRGIYVMAGLAALAFAAKLAWHHWFEYSWDQQYNWDTYINQYTLYLTVRDFLAFLVGLLLVIMVAKVRSNEKASRAQVERLLAELERSHRLLPAYSEKVAELGIIRKRKRVRVAREIHHGLGIIWKA